MEILSAIFLMQVYSTVEALLLQKHWRNFVSSSA